LPTIFATNILDFSKYTSSKEIWREIKIKIRISTYNFKPPSILELVVDKRVKRYLRLLSRRISTASQSRQHSRFDLDVLGALWIVEEVVEEVDLDAHLVQLVLVLRLEVLAHELGTLELLARQRAQPLVLRQLDRVRRHERLHLPENQEVSLFRSRP
jgi:hypothetical protein